MPPAPRKPRRRAEAMDIHPVTRDRLRIGACFGLVKDQAIRHTPDACQWPPNSSQYSALSVPHWRAALADPMPADTRGVAGVVVRATCYPRNEAASSRRNRAVGLVRREYPVASDRMSSWKRRMAARVSGPKMPSAGRGKRPAPRGEGREMNDEQIKLRARFTSNIGVGLIIVAMVLPNSAAGAALVDPCRDHGRAGHRRLCLHRLGHLVCRESAAVIPSTGIHLRADR